jgi:peptide/nickel transport system substrate-binding protein
MVVASIDRCALEAGCDPGRQVFREEGDVEDPSAVEGLTRRELLKRAGAGAVVLGTYGKLAASAKALTTSKAIKRGGRLRVAFVGGGPTETLDPNRGSAIIEIGMATVMYEKLFDRRNPKGVVEPVLAESMEPNKNGDVWTLRLKPGIEWHNGKPLTVDDVMYTFRRILNPKNALAGINVISFIDAKQMKKLDSRTLRLTFHAPFADPEAAFTTRFLPIIQNGFTDFRHPVGTGPFKLKSFTPGKGSLFTANKSYWGGAPYLDELQYTDIPDPTARVNALLSGQIDAMEALPGAQVETLKKNASVRVLQSPNGGHSKLCFRVTDAPFSDVRVRQALRLLCNRPQTIQNGVFGLGVIGNDLVCRFDPDYAHEIPQRQYDPQQAKSLLKAAGHENLQVTLESSSAAVGMLEAAQIFAQTAQAGGVTVKVNNNPADTYFSKIWGNVPFFQDEWGMYSLHDQLALNYVSTGLYNGFKWSDPKVDGLFKQAQRTLDETKRRDLYVELQREMWDAGPDIVWGSPSVLDGLRANVKGLVPSAARPLGYFKFERVWLE